MNPNLFTSEVRTTLGPCSAVDFHVAVFELGAALPRMALIRGRPDQGHSLPACQLSAALDPGGLARGWHNPIDTPCAVIPHGLIEKSPASWGGCPSVQTMQTLGA